MEFQEHRNDITVGGFTAKYNSTKHQWVFPGGVRVGDRDRANRLAKKYAEIIKA